MKKKTEKINSCEACGMMSYPPVFKPEPKKPASDKTIVKPDVSTPASDDNNSNKMNGCEAPKM